MPVTTIIGAQWGDEGKGKIVDLLAGTADVVARWGGGPNAGHTVVIGDEKYVLHHIPSGILNPDSQCLLGAGVVVDPWSFLEELAMLDDRKIDVTNRLFIDGRAHLILPWHRRLDACQERSAAIGTTGRGIGPAYSDKVARTGIRLADCLDEAKLIEKIRKECTARNELIVSYYKDTPLDVEGVLEDTLKTVRKLRPFVADVSLMLWQAVAKDRKVLMEGAQGTLLDINFGTYPYVTSSEPIAGGASTGLGIGPRFLTKVLGIAKAYVTRVGNGPFPTEIQNELGTQLRTRGREFGSTTGRARRVGWWDNVIAKYSVRLNGLTGWAITKLDVLSGLDRIPVCVAYETPNGIIDEFPMDTAGLENCTPVFEYAAGWKQDISQVTSYQRLPIETRRYIDLIQRLTNVQVEWASIGERRDQTIRVN